MSIFNHIIYGLIISVVILIELFINNAAHAFLIEEKKYKILNGHVSKSLVKNILKSINVSISDEIIFFETFKGCKHITKYSNNSNYNGGILIIKLIKIYISMKI